MAIESPLQKLIVTYLEGIGVTQRKFAEVTGMSETTFGTYRRMTSAMGIDALDKILTEYPGLKPLIVKYLGGNTEENVKKHTADTKDTESAVTDEEKWEIVIKRIEYLERQLPKGSLSNDQ